MAAKVQIRMNAQIMADYMVYQVFKSTPGIAAVALAALNAGLAVALAIGRRYPFALLCLLVVLVVGLGFPRLIRRRVTKRMEGYTRLTEPVTYEFTEKGVTTTTFNDSGTASWGKFTRAVQRKNLLLLYAGRSQAIILPIDQIGDEYAAITELIRTHMPAGAVRIG